MHRIDLFVTPEEYGEVRALGACWDQHRKCWYINAAASDRRFVRWLPEAAPGDESDSDFLIESSEAFVACGRSVCRRCHHGIDVVCLYCGCGTVDGELLETFRVQGVWAVDEELQRQLLQRWPGYRMAASEGIYLNHCPHCGGSQDEADLHEEPGQPFHDLCREVPKGIELEALHGRVRLSGDYVADV